MKLLLKLQNDYWLYGANDKRYRTRVIEEEGQWKYAADVFGAAGWVNVAWGWADSEVFARDEALVVLTVFHDGDA